MSQPDPWVAIPDEVLARAFDQVRGEITTTANGRMLSLWDRGRIARWLASKASTIWWSMLGLEQSRGCASQRYVNAVREILELDANPRYPESIAGADREFLEEALEYLEDLRRVPAQQPGPKKIYDPIESAAEEGMVGTRQKEQLESFIREYLVQDPEASLEAVHEAAQERGVCHVTRSTFETAYFYRVRGEIAEEQQAEELEDSTEDPEPAGEDDYTPEPPVELDEPEVKLKDVPDLQPSLTVNSEGTYLDARRNGDGSYYIDASMEVPEEIFAELMELAVEGAFGDAGA